MTKEVVIIIEGTQIGAEESPILMTASGTYHRHHDKHYIQYEEPAEDGQGCIKNMVKIGASQIEMTKKGAASSEMRFDMNNKSEITYQTPYGSLFFESQTSQITIVEEEASIEVAMEYSLYSNNDRISDNRTIIRILSSPSPSVEEV
jgi:uncharacterized beta-barrel protein YwiB (DUF1934 family)